MSGTKSSGPLRAVQWADAAGVALRKPDGGMVSLAGLDHTFRVVENFVERVGKTISLTGVTVDSTNKLFDKGYRATLTYSGSGTNNAFVEFSLSGGLPYQIDLDSSVCLAVYVHAVNPNTQLLVMPSTNYASNSNAWSLSAGGLEPGFQIVPLGLHDYGQNGTDPASGPYNKLRLYVRQSGGAAGTVSDVTFLGLFQGRRRKGRVVVGFDDAYAGVYTYALPKLVALGWPVQVWCDGRALGAAWDPNVVMTAAQLRECQAAGWSVGVQAHGRHDILDTEAAITADVAAAKAALIAEGIVVDAMYAYDGGYRAATRQNSYNALAANGFTHARTTSGQRFVTLGEQIVDGYRMNPYAWPGQGVAQTQLNNGAALSRLESVVATGSDVIFYAHDIVATTVSGGREATDMTVAQLDVLLTAIDAYRRAGGLEVVTMGDMARTAPMSPEFYTR